MNLKEKYYIQNSIVSVINNLMMQHNVSSMDMLNIVDSIGSQLKDLIIQELVSQQSQVQQEMTKISKEGDNGGDSNEDVIAS